MDRLDAAFEEPGSEARVPPVWAQPFAWLAVAVLGFAAALAAASFYMAIRGSAEAITEDWKVIVGVSLVWLAAMAAAALAWARWAERRPLASAGVPTLRHQPVPLQRFAFGLLWALAATALGLALGAEDASFAELWRTLGARPLACLLALVVLLPLVAVAAAAEEILFRGWILSGLAARAGRRAAVVVSAVLFAALHVYPTTWGDPAFALSALAYVLIAVTLSLIALRDGHVYGSSAFHTGYNLVAFYVALLAGGLDPAAVTDLLQAERAVGQFGPAAAFAALELILVLALVRRWRGRLRPSA